MAKMQKPAPSEGTQRVVAALAWALVAFCGMSALALFLDVPFLWWLISTLLTMGLLAWAMDRKWAREQQWRAERDR